MIQNSKYYRSVDDVKRKNTKQSEKEVEKALDCDQVLKEKCFNSEFKEIENCFLKESVYDSKRRQYN